MNQNLNEVIDILNMHQFHFIQAKYYADKTQQPIPEDSRAWSQILISSLTGINGLARKKGPDLLCGSDVKAANAWCAIDRPRFNGCIKAGTQSPVSGNMISLDQMPYLFFVLWDIEPKTNYPRTRIWCVRPQYDTKFREICNEWYRLLKAGFIKSTNFQLHPPINLNSNQLTNRCGNLNYPLLLNATYIDNTYVIQEYNEDILSNGYCS